MIALQRLPLDLSVIEHLLLMGADPCAENAAGVSSLQKLETMTVTLEVTAARKLMLEKKSSPP